jgi:hypothetical protein
MIVDSDPRDSAQSLRKSIRQGAAEAAAFRQKMAEANARRLEHERREKVAREFVDTLRERLKLEVDASAVEFRDGTPLLVIRDEPDDLLFSFTPTRYQGSDFGYSRAALSLAWMCNEGHVVTTTDIESFADLHDRIRDVDAWEAGTSPCPACEHLRREERRAAEPLAPAPRTAAQRLAEALAEVVREIVDEAREEA